MTHAISTFNFRNHEVRTISGSDPWFCLVDVCSALGLTNPRKTRTQLSSDGVTKSYVIDNLGRQQETTFVNEPNLYRLIFRSNKPQAQAFADWVYNEVLPSIRKTGSYGVPSLTNDRATLKAIGGIVKSCAAVAVREEIDHSVNNALERLFNPNPIENRNLFRFCSILQSVLNDSLDDILCTADKKDLENRRLKRALQKANSKLKQINASAQPIVIE